MGYQIKEERLPELLGNGTREDLAVKARLRPSCITRAVKGDGCRFETIQAILKAGGISTDWRSFIRDGDLARLNAPKRPQGAASVPLCMAHRSKPELRNKYYRGALASGRRVLYISIISRDSFARLAKYLTDDTQLRVLTWKPSTVGEVAGFSKHLKEGDDKVDQAQGALETWDEFLEIRPDIEVRTYDSTPTMQGIIVENDWAMIELMPYATRPPLRPAILVRRSEPTERKAFNFFSDVFKTLFEDSIPRRPCERSSWFRSPSDRLGASA